MEEGATIVLGGATAALLLKELFAWLRSRNQRTEIAPQPLEVKGAPKYVTCEQCELRHKDVEKRLEAGDRAFQELRHDIHSGFQRVTDRISPVAEACAANSAALQVLLKHQPSGKMP